MLQLGFPNLELYGDLSPVGCYCRVGLTPKSLTISCLRYYCSLIPEGLWFRQYRHVLDTMAGIP